MKYRYVGTEPCRLGSSLVRPGDVLSMAAPLDKNWVLVEPPKPKAEEPKPAKRPVEKKELDHGE